MATILNISDIQLFNLPKVKLGEKEAEQLVQFVRAETSAQAEEKFRYYRSDIDNLEKKVTTEIAASEKKLTSEIAAKVSDSKAEMIKWMFIFVFTSTLTTIGSILAIIKYFLK